VVSLLLLRRELRTAMAGFPATPEAAPDAAAAPGVPDGLDPVTALEAAVIEPESP